MYHQIAEVPEAYDPLRHAMPLSRFKQQMNYLYRANFHCLHLKDAVRQWRKGLHPLSSSAPKRFVITFDDGYRDLYTTVWPILKRLGFTATIFFGRRAGWRKE